MANASNSNMNIPNTFNLTGTWQNNVEPLNTNRQTNVRQQANRVDASENISSYVPLNNNTNPNLTTNSNELANLSQSRVQAQTMPINQSSFGNQMLNQDVNENRTGVAQATVLNNNGNQNNINFQDFQTLENFIKTQIGKNSTIEFLIGENSLIEKTGTIVSVGENYVLLNETSTRNLIGCDLKSIKFIYFEY